MVSDFIVQGYGYLRTYKNFSVLGVNYWCHYTFEVHVYNIITQLKKIMRLLHRTNKSRMYNIVTFNDTDINV